MANGARTCFDQFIKIDESDPFINTFNYISELAQLIIVI